MNRRITLFVFLIFCQPVNFLYAQTVVIDSLRSAFSATVSESDKLGAAVNLLDEYESLHTDTILRYYNISQNLLQRNFSDETALKICITKIRLLRRQSRFDEAMTLCDSCLAVSEAAQYDPAIYRKLIAAKTAILTSQFKYKEALDISFSVLKKAETEKDHISQVFGKISIGWINMEMKKNTDALKWFFEANALSDKIGYLLKKGTTYANIAAVYADLKQMDSAEFYIHQAFDVALKQNNLTVQANCYYIFSDIMVENGKIAEAEQAMNEGLKIRKIIGDPYFYVSDLYQLAIFYANNKQPQKGIAASLEGIAFAEKNKLSGKYLILFESLALNYKIAGNDKLYAGTLEKIVAIKDSLYKNNSAQSLAEMQTKYEVQKKETLIAQQKLGLFQRKLLLYGAAILAILVLGYSFYRFKKYEQRQKIKVAAMIREEKLQNDQAVKDAEEKERKRIAAELHDNLGVQANAILHSSSLLNENNSSNKPIVADLQETAKEMLHNLRETLWAMKSADVAAAGLWLRIINFMKQMARHYGSIHFKVEGEAPGNFIISSAKALHIILLLQEAVNNAIKHASATTITAESTVTKEGWNISVTDNGSGFDQTLIKSKHTDSYGLQNMQERATASAIDFSIKSIPEKGTVVMITIK